MKSLLSFTKKELLEQLRSGKILLVGILFTVFGIMNPAIAKLTPWLLETLKDSLAESGMSVTVITVTAMDSWVQFFKNIPMGLIAFILIQCSIFTKEYSSGTLVLALTKGLPRVQVVVAKATVLISLWSMGYWLCFGITYAYNAYYWDNSIAQNLLFSTLCWWIFGGFVICLITLFSTCFRSTSGVLLGIGGTVFALYLLGLLPKVSRFVPTALTDGTSLIYGVKKSEDFLPALIITAAIGFFTLFVGASVFNKKRL